METSYKSHFAQIKDAESYDCEEYATNSYSSVLWELEKAKLRSLLAEFRQRHSAIEYLDFAAGTGRVTTFMENMVNKATAIEISEAMAMRAAQRLVKTQVLCRDITEKNALVEGKYDVITAFRFFLNAEPDLQMAAMRALTLRLRDETSWLVFNNHGNLWSLKALGWPYHRLRKMGKGWQTRGNYLRHSQIKHLLKNAGMRLVKVIGLGVLGGRIAARMPFDRALELEEKLSANPIYARFGQNQIYVACLDNKVPTQGKAPLRA